MMKTQMLHQIDDEGLTNIDKYKEMYITITTFL